jgi:diguanylate cyclase (GGDEF)-like protein/PAS domain S-box-containing protein
VNPLDLLRRRSEDGAESWRARAEQAEERFQALAASTSAALFLIQDGVIRLANPAAGVLAGCRSEELPGRAFLDFVHEDHHALVGQGEARCEMKLRSAQGEERWADTTRARVPYQDGEAVVFLAFDVTERKLAEQALRENERRLRDILDNVQLVALLLDCRGEVTYANEYLLGLLGAEEEKVLGAAWFDAFVAETVRAELKQAFLENIGTGMIQPHQEYELLTGHGDRRLISWDHTVLHDLEGRVIGTASLGSDITERRRVESQLLHDAFHDALTGLPNRALVLDRLGNALARAQRGRHHFAVLFLDLDRFKLVNDSLGHLVGDRLLVEISRVLDGAVRPGDTVARLGGDEFTILLDDVVDPDEAIRVAQRIHEALAAPFDLEGKEVFVTASIGIAFSQAGYARPEDVLRDADTAMYQAKASGKARHQLFDASMHSRALRLLELENDLRRAVERSDFLLHFQPVVHIGSGHIVAFEALVRWDHPQRGLVAPAEFIALAEETGLIDAIGRWALREACATRRSWEHADPLSVNVNLSSRQLSQPDLVESVAEVLRATGLSPGLLTLEITETAVMQNPESAVGLLRGLKELGARVCIDDFGTGYSSLNYLLRLPADVLKIDRAFVTALGRDERNDKILAAIISLAGSLGLEVVAEGVETEEQRARLQALGCPYAQGYLFSRPVDAVRALALLQAGAVPLGAH